MDNNLKYIGNNLRKTVDGSTLAIEKGADLGISFLDHRTQEWKTFQLNSPELTLLISYLKEAKRKT